MDVIVGTAGHIDHGKTALVKALTGVDADRLPEEKRRGITVDLGFAEMSAGDVHFGFVDVPGHERFVKNMLAGASGIDLVLFVVAADEGVMPQTREHFDICRLLGLKSGVIALTKSDLVDEETLELARLDVSELVEGSFLDGAPVISVSARTGTGLDSLTAALTASARDLASRIARYITRLPIDRSFSMKGFGAVVTGTLASGEIREGAEFDLLPVAKRVRVRGLQTHGRSVKTAYSGQRVAVNLGGVVHTDIVRGMMLGEPGALKPTRAVDAFVEVLAASPRPLRSRQRVRVHLGTAEVLARVRVLNDRAEIAPGENGFVQLRLEDPSIAVIGERFIIRSYSPQITIAGGEIVDPHAPRHRRRDLSLVTTWLEQIRVGDDADKVRFIVAASGDRGTDMSEMRSRTGFSDEVLRSAITQAVSERMIVDCDGQYVDSASFEKLRAKTRDAVAAFHKREPLAKGMPVDEVRSGPLAFAPEAVYKAVLRSLEPEVVVEKEIVRLASHRTELSPAETAFLDKLKRTYHDAGLEVPKTEEAIAQALQGTGLTAKEANKLLHVLLSAGDLVRVTEDMCFDGVVIRELIRKIRDHADRTGNRVLDVAVFKEIAGVSRKYAIPLLEYLDREKVTTRAGANRVIL